MILGLPKMEPTDNCDKVVSMEQKPAGRERERVIGDGGWV